MSRRSFIASAVLGTTGFWVSSSNQLGARAVRGLVAESSRGVLQPQQVPKPEEWDDAGITAAWLGHSTVLVNFFGLTIITDPVLFRRIGLNLRLGTIGPKRLVAPALHVNQLPPIDLVLLSHAHMDHFDMATLRCFPKTTQVVTAYATGDLLARTRLRQVTELAWGEQTTIKARQGEVVVKAFPVSHWGARWRRDYYRGYAGYTLEREGKKIIFGGDTAWSESFRGLHRHGPFEMAIMPIGAYQPWIGSHCTPEQSVQMANAAGAKYFLPIHHKTFPLGREGPFEPMQRLRVALEPERMAWKDVGATFSCPVA